MRETLSQFDSQAVEKRTREIGREIFDRMQLSRPKPWNRRWWDEQMMDWAMSDERVKARMFRFVDVLPALHSHAAVVEHLHEYFRDVLGRLPAAARAGLPLAQPGTLAGGALAKAARLGAQSQARQFIAGATFDEVLAAAKRERKQHRAFTLDILGEAVISEAEAYQHFRDYLDLIQNVAPVVNAWPEVEQIDRDREGPLPRANVSVKLSALDSQADAIDPEGAFARIAPRLRELLRVARKHRAFVNIDMESYSTKDLTLYIFKRVLSEDEFRDFSNVGIVIQCYLKDAERDLRDLRDWSRERGAPVWVRIVKGAYWDYETVHARQENWPAPVFQRKWETDANFEQRAEFLLQNQDWLRPAIASHNVRSVAHALAVAEHLGLPRDAFELQMLYGMADPEKRALVEMGHRMRVYMPFGELIPGMAYLVRRLLENTSNDSFLRASFSERAAPEELLMNPQQRDGRATARPAGGHAGVAEPPASGPWWRTFRNEPLSDFAKSENREAMRRALDEVAKQFGRPHPLVIDNEPFDTNERIESRDPSDKQRIVGATASAGADDARRAAEAAHRALPRWAGLGAEGRAKYLRAVADILRRRRFELAAWEVYECAKEWREADADIAEAIDFCEFYAAGAIDLEKGEGVDLAGEENTFVHLPRGVAAVISPWNFPLAILTGMTAAALATGNTVVMKPAEQSSVVAAKLMEVFQEANLPAGVVNYLPGLGEVAGAALVAHPAVRLIAFTGSRGVGLAINAQAAELSRRDHRGVKHVIAEMGGKNAIIVDEDADLDEAVQGVIRSAFGYQGQKCSACSRAIVLKPAHKTFVARLIEAARSLKVGPASDPATSVGPVIDEESFDRVHRYIETGKEEATLALAVDVGDLAERGYYVGPHIFTEVAPDARIAQEEIFGPVLAVIEAADMDEALRIANGTDYALTGGVYSRSPANLERVQREFLVGNLYLNRACTGALVGRQPFGGFKMSGIGSKAGGRDYLLQFVLPKTITENTMRRGFAPPGETESADAERGI